MIRTTIRMPGKEDRSTRRLGGVLFLLALLFPNAAASWSLLHRPRTTRSCSCCYYSAVVIERPTLQPDGTGCSGWTTGPRRTVATHLGLSSRRKNDPNDDDSEGLKKNQPGIEEAFRRLEALGEDAFKGETALSNNKPSAKPIELLRSSSADDDGLTLSEVVENAPPVSLESEVKVYKELVGEMEANEESAEYLNILDELGGQTNKQTFDTYSTVLQDLGGTPKGFGQITTANRNDNNDDVTIPDAISEEMLLKAGSTERFLESALQDAMKDIQLNNPNLMGQNNDIMSDANLKLEIAKIFDAGNERLQQSLEEIKQEQRQLIQEAQRLARNRPNPVEQDAQRLLAAEKSMQTILQKVSTESSEVERAVADLNAAQSQLSDDFIYKLQKGGWPKQAALVGILLFSIRSLVDSVTAVTTDDASALSTALIQGGIALACAILFAIL